MTAEATPDDTELQRLRRLASETSALRRSDNVMVARAADRVSVILIDLLTEVAPFEFLGPWQPVD